MARLDDNTLRRGGRASINTSITPVTGADSEEKPSECYKTRWEEGYRDHDDICDTLRTSNVFNGGQHVRIRSEICDLADFFSKGPLKSLHNQQLG